MTEAGSRRRTSLLTPLALLAFAANSLLGGGFTLMGRERADRRARGGRR